MSAVSGNAIAVAIAITFALLVLLVLSALFPYPEDPSLTEPTNEPDCIAAGGEWVDDPVYPYCEFGDAYYEAYYNTLVFNSTALSVLSAAIALLAVLFGLFYIKKPAIATGLLFGGILVLCWDALTTLFISPISVVFIAAVLAILLLAAYKKEKK